MPAIITTLFLLQLCASWHTIGQVGELPSRIDESSGIAFSRRYPDRVYHVNDSGDVGSLFITDRAGKNLREVKIRGFDPVDVEDLGMAPCGDGRSCIVIADVGNNDLDRRAVELIFVEEVDRFPDSVRPLKRVRIRYPGQAYDSESVAVHPDGTILLLTKNSREGTAQLFKLSSGQWSTSDGAVQQLSHAGAIDLKKVFPDVFLLLRSPTSMDISEDGRRLLILTYQDAVEFALDLSKAEVVFNPVRIRLRALQQQEAAAYVPGEHAFVYTTESMLLFRSPLMKVSCAQPGLNR